MTDAQKAQAKQILEKERPTIRPLYQQLAQERHQLRQIVESGTFDEAQVRAIASQQAQTMTEMTVQHTRVASELVQILTPEQKAKLSKFLDRHERRFQKHMQPDQGQPDAEPQQ
jgi:protein CpxP